MTKWRVNINSRLAMVFCIHLETKNGDQKINKHYSFKVFHLDRLSNTNPTHVSLYYFVICILNSENQYVNKFRKYKVITCLNIY
jgi:hypothetical protein